MTGFVINARPFTPDSAAAWEELVQSSINATFLQTRRFLGYHADRFVDRSLLLETDKGRLVGIFPAAIAGQAQDEIESHPGLTHGGLLHDGSLSGERAVLALQAVLDHYRQAGVRRLTYKLIPFPFRASPSQDDAWALNRLQARLVRSDLSTLLDLSQGPRLKSGRSDDLRKARRAGLEVATGRELLAPLWQLIADVLHARHGSRPVHSLAELRQLAELFPEQLELVAARKEGELLAGAVLFHFQHCTHTQYLASSPQGQSVGALTLTMEHALRAAAERGKRWFSFGTSTMDVGRSLNAGLYDWKCSFGGSGLVHETYALDLV